MDVMDTTRRRTLPRGGLSLPCIGMGCAPLGGLYQPVSDAQARATLDGAWDAGVRFFDTAPFYGYTRSEHRLGAARAAPRSFCCQHQGGTVDAARRLRAPRR